MLYLFTYTCSWYYILVSLNIIILVKTLVSVFGQVFIVTIIFKAKYITRKCLHSLQDMKKKNKVPFSLSLGWREVDRLRLAVCYHGMSRSLLWH